MSSARNYTLQELQQKQQKASARQAYLLETAKRAAARQKALQKKIAEREKDERQKQLVSRGELLESFFSDAPSITDERLSAILSLAFSQPAVKAAIRDAAAPASLEPITGNMKQEADSHEGA